MATPKPLGRNVVIVEVKDLAEIQTDIGFIEGTVTAGGIIIPKAVHEHQDKMARGSTRRGLVLAVGNAVEEVEEGNEVIYNMHAAKEMDIEDQTYLVINVHDIWAVISKNDNTGREGAGS